MAATVTQFPSGALLIVYLCDGDLCDLAINSKVEAPSSQGATAHQRRNSAAAAGAYEFLLTKFNIENGDDDDRKNFLSARKSRVVVPVASSF